MKNIVVILNGSGCSGKDTFVNFVREIAASNNSIEIYCLSSVEAVKDAAKVLGWDGVKDVKGRKFLADLKDMSTSFYDGPFRYIRNEYEKIINTNPSKTNIIFIMVREPVEIRRIFDTYSPNSTSVLIRRHDVTYGNHADDCVEGYPYDYIIENYNSLEDFKVVAKCFWKDFCLDFEIS